MTVTTQHTDRIATAKTSFVDALPDHFERLRWDAEQLTVWQTDRLHNLLRIAAARSPFHAARLAGIDLDAVTPDRLDTLPVMTKPEMMAAFDDVVTDRRITRGGVQQHLDAIDEQPRLFLDEFVVMASGGSSGVRGIFVNDLSGAAEQMAAVVRGGLARVASMIGWPPPGPIPTAIVAARSAIHATRILSSIYLAGGLNAVTYAPVTLPFDEIVRRVQAAQPMLIVGYPSTVARLADAQIAGRLAISPMAVTVTSEQLTDDHTARITAGFGMPPTNSYGSSEGLMGTAPPGSPVFDFASDAALVEFVDAEDRPVAPGDTAHHVLVTNISNTVQPLIRYRIDDTMVAAPASADHGHQRATLRGRTDEHVTIGGVSVHPLTLRSALLAGGGITEYQVRATGVDLDVAAVTAGPIELSEVENDLSRALTDAGVPRINVTVRAVDSLPRDPDTGKTRRFVNG